jgi:ABC-2 type transport system permease protein
VGSAILLAAAAPVYGLPPMHHVARVLPAVLLGATGFVSIGILLGTILPSARAAQGIGLILFFPSFLLGAGGPPPHVMGSALRSVAGYLPLTRVTDAVRDPWLGTGTAAGSLVVVALLAVLGTALALRRSAL